MKVNKNKENELDWDYLYDILIYDTNTGIFTNKITRNSRAVINKEAGSLRNDGYIELSINGIKYRAHRLAWFYEYGKWPDDYIDHIDGNKDNNRLNNLRECSCTQNEFNKGKIKGTSKYKGVYWDRGKWRVSISHNKKSINIGRFNNEKEAAIAYNKAALDLEPDFAIINKI